MAQTGALPYLGCTHNGTVLDEVWYYNHVSGTVRLMIIILIMGASHRSAPSGAIWPLQAYQHDVRQHLFVDRGRLVL